MFLILAYIGSFLSVILFAGLIFGFVDLDLDADMDSDTSFKVFSLQNVSYFLMTGGWVGVWSTNRMHDTVTSVILFILGGSLSVIISQVILVFAKRLTHISLVDYNSAIGGTGKVVVAISPNSAGKVQTVVSGKLIELSARGGDKFIATGETVKIQSVNNNELIVA